jgi:gamma-glutamyltranspeptidase / glutathione hydrolase
MQIMTSLPLRVIAAFTLFLTPLSATLAGTGTVSAADPRGAEAGREILAAGGSATDAAMAMMLALTVVEPASSGIGGGGFLLHHDASNGMVASIDGREMAPAATTAERFLSADGKPLPFMAAFPGGRSVGIPGNIALMGKAHARWGTLPWAQLFEPAIRLAEQGYTVNTILATRLKLVEKLWADFPGARAIYWKDGAPAKEGDLIRNPDLAVFLKRLAAQGPDAFYKGDNPAQIIAATAGSALAPATITQADFDAYVAKARPPVCGHYRGYRLCGMGPPSSGATTVFQILGMLERFNLKALGKDNPESWHLIGEAMRLAYADRETWAADRDHADVPVAGLIDPAYIGMRSRLISRSKALGRYAPGTPPGARAAMARAPSGEVPSTTHFVAVDSAGNIAAMTSTIEGPFGSQLVANGYFLNNELTDFSAQPVKDGRPVANRPGPTKRPLSSMSPTIVYDPSGQPIFTVGAAGGKTIIMQVTKALIAHLDWGLDAGAALALGQIYFNDKGLILEEGTGLEAMKSGLEARGQTVKIAPLGLKANAAQRVGADWVGAADPRSVGSALPH